MCYYNGRGVPEDAAEAVRWWQKAAEQGFAKSQILLGMAIAFGEGTAKNPVMAYKWFLIAHASGEKDFDEDLDSRKKAFMRGYGNGLTSSQRGEAQRLAKEFKPVKAGTTAL